MQRNMAIFATKKRKGFASFASEFFANFALEKGVRDVLTQRTQRERKDRKGFASFSAFASHKI